jgi:hypothetical protein
MPPSVVKSIRDLLFWQYAKIISESAGAGKKNYRFVMNRFKKLQNGDIHWSTSIREYVKEHNTPDVCIYCGATGKLTLEHILPTSRGGPDDPDNAVWVCRTCNSSKGSSRLYEWYGLNNRYKVPRIAEGKYLKLLYQLHEQLATLDVEEIPSLCPRCDLGQKCPVTGKLTVYCLEGCFLKT